MMVELDEVEDVKRYAQVVVLLCLKLCVCPRRCQRRVGSRCGGCPSIVVVLVVVVVFVVVVVVVVVNEVCFRRYLRGLCGCMGVFGDLRRCCCVRCDACCRE